MYDVRRCECVFERTRALWDASEAVSAAGSGQRFSEKLCMVSSNGVIMRMQRIELINLSRRSGPALRHPSQHARPATKRESSCAARLASHRVLPCDVRSISHGDPLRESLRERRPSLTF